MVMNPVEHEQLLQQLDQRQDDVLERLEELSHDITRLIDHWTNKDASTHGDRSSDSQRDDEEMRPIKKDA